VLARWRPFRPFANPLDGEVYPCEARPTDPMRNALRLRGALSLMPDKSKKVKPDLRKTPGAEAQSPKERGRLERRNQKRDSEEVPRYQMAGRLAELHSVRRITAVSSHAKGVEK
jgi:hypothetical protein